ncbi:MAG: hypothetical protein ACLUI3_07145 [Christensenellales bacterium]
MGAIIDPYQADVSSFITRYLLRRWASTRLAARARKRKRISPPPTGRVALPRADICRQARDAFATPDTHYRVTVGAAVRRAI